jgi:hypothetical protein
VFTHMLIGTQAEAQDIARALGWRADLLAIRPHYAAKKVVSVVSVGSRKWCLWRVCASPVCVCGVCVCVCVSVYAGLRSQETPTPSLWPEPTRHASDPRSLPGV